MGLFDAFTPEGLIRAMGIDPRELIAFISTLKSELLAMKSGFRDTVLHFDARLKTIEAAQLRIEQLLLQSQRQYPLNQLGVITNERYRNGHE